MMNAKRTLAVLLAVLMTLSVLVVPTAATTVTHASTLVSYKFTTTTDSELDYLDESIGVGTKKTDGGTKWAGRYKDNAGYFGYAFDFVNGTIPTKVMFKAQMRGGILVQVSVDKTNWKTAYTLDNFPGVTAEDNPAWRELDLTSAMLTALDGKTTAEKLYVRFGDYDAALKPSGGYGTNILASHEASLVLDYSKGTTVTGNTVSYGFVPAGLVEKSYLDASIGTGNVDPKLELKANYGRLADRGVKFGYDFMLNTPVMPTKAVLSANTGGEIKIEVSTDKTNWVEAFVTADGEDYKTPTSRVLDVTEAVQKAWKTGATHLYLRISDKTPADGWGGNLLASAPVDFSLTYGNNVAIMSFSPNKAWSGTEAQYKHPVTKANGNGQCHFADKANFIVYAYEMLSTDELVSLNYSLRVAGQLHLSVSADNLHWVDVYKWDGTPAANGSGGLSAQKVVYDLLDAYNKAKALSTGASSMLYVRIADSHTDAGWGGSVYYDEYVTLVAEYPAFEQPAEMCQYTTTFAGLDTKYYAGGGRNTGNALYADGAALVKFQFPTTGIGASERILLTMQPTQQFFLDVSIDGANWVRAFTYNDTGYMATMAEAANQGQFFFASRVRTFDLTAAVKQAVADSEAAGTSDSGLLIRYGDSHKDWVNKDGTLDTTKSSGWGGKAEGTLTLAFAKVEGLGAVAQMGKDTVTDVEESGWDSNNHAPQYRLIGQEPMLVDDPGYAIGNLSNNVAASRVIEEDGVLVALGDGNYNGRNADNSYFMYRYEIPSTATSLIWSATLGGAYGVDITVSSDYFPPMADSSDWINVALYSEDGLDGTSQSIAKTITYDLTGLGVEEGDKYVFFKIYDADLETAGWGGRVALGRNYGVSMAWATNLEADLALVGMKSVSLNLTENFNLIYKPTLPLSASDVVVQVGLEGMAMTTIEPSEDGSYRFDGILPQEMGDKVIFRMTGKVCGVEDFTYELSYSVKQYCSNMMTQMADDAELVDLLEKILIYGAAAQQKAGYKADALVTDGLVDTSAATEFDPTRLSGVYSTRVSGKPTGAAEWASATLKLDNTLEVIYKFAADDVTGLQLRVHYSSGKVQLFGEEDFVASGTNAEGVKLWTVNVPIMAHEFATALFATFVVDGVEHEDYMLTYSVNTYINAKYDGADAAYQKLMAAIADYGRAVNEYLYSR